MVGPAGLELATSWSQTKRSSLLSYGPIVRAIYQIFEFLTSLLGVTRLKINMRKKLKFFADNKTRPNIIEAGKPLFESNRGHWSDYFGNDLPIVLEVGCGRGDYTVGLAAVNQDKNFIGVDIKGDRLWYGSGLALEKNLTNVAFLRTQIELLGEFFEPGEVAEIWITFPGPRPKKKQAKKRLTAQKFLDIYKKILSPQGTIHLKTDSDELFEFTLETLADRNDIKDLISVSNLYASSNYYEAKAIQTHFEKRFLAANKQIKYIQFSFDNA